MPQITAFNKIGFHAGPAGNHTGIGEYYRRLDEAGIPFVIKSADHYGHIFEATQYRNADHVYCFRLSSFGQPGDFNFDVPDYSLSPKLAAKKQWKHMEERLPPEFDRSKVWIEPINEIDKDRCDWLGEFACEFGEIALEEDIKVMQFGWSAGEPEREGWETPGMISYFKMCEQHPDRLGVSLHEYSYVTDEIWRLRGDLVGRFKILYDVCDAHGIQRPKVIMSEWGWAYQKVPSPHVAIRHIEEVNELYAQYPNIIGAGIWYLGSGYASIHNQAQRLIGPVTELSLNKRYTVEQNMPAPATTPSDPIPNPVIPILIAQPTEPVVETPAPTTPPPVDTPPEPEKVSNSAYVADVTIPDDMNVEAGSRITKTWRLRNTGETTWNSSYKLTFIGGNPMGDRMAVDVPAAAPGQTVEISVPMIAPAQKEGTVFGDWRMVTPTGQQFGDVFYVRITVVPKTDGVDSMVFAADITVLDDSEIDGGSGFTKTWRIRNNGDTTWRAGYKLTFVGGAAMAGVETIDLPQTAPGQTAEVSVPMTAPVTPGVHWSDFRAQNTRGEFFGDIIYVRIVVPQPINLGGRITPLSQNDPRWKAARLGDAHSDSTIGEWGCLITCLTMVANSYGKSLTPDQVNEKMNRKRLFIKNRDTPFNTLSSLYTDIKYNGRRMANGDPTLIDAIDASLRAGNPVAVQVDYTPQSAYSPNDQHWVLIVGRAGDDYRINDPWVYPNVETSFKMRYARPGQLIKDSIISALFYDSTRPKAALPVAGAGVLSAEDQAPDFKVDPDFTMLSTGLNIDPTLANANPHNETTLKGLDWVRFVYKVSGQPDPENRSLKAAFKVYDETIRDYHRRGTGSILVLSEETMWAGAPWAKDGDWNAYATHFAEMAGQIARHYRRMDDAIAFEIWHKQDLEGNPAGVAIPPAEYANLLTKTATIIRKAAPDAKLIVGGLVSGTKIAVDYLKKVEAAAGELPVDAIGLQPYGRWATRAPFDWGTNFPPLSELVDAFEDAFPNLPLWITEIGVASSEPIAAVHNDEIGKYMLDVYKHISIRYSKRVPVVSWYAYSDLMNQAGVFDFDGMPKIGMGDAFRTVLNKEWK